MGREKVVTHLGGSEWKQNVPNPGLSQVAYVRGMHDNHLHQFGLISFLLKVTLQFMIYILASLQNHLLLFLAQNIHHHQHISILHILTHIFQHHTKIISKIYFPTWLFFTNSYSTHRPHFVNLLIPIDFIICMYFCSL